MKYLILSDIHSNQEALSAVLAFVRRKRWDKAVFLGDLVGYGANPNQTVDIVRALKPLVAIRGNHDKVCSGHRERRAVQPHRARGGDVDAAQAHAARTCDGCSRCPRARSSWTAHFAISHGTPIDEDAYIFGEIEALNVFRQTDFPLCFFGHSHFPVIFALSPDAITTILTVAPVVPLQAAPGVRYLINPGSIGQPRDGNPLCLVRDLRQRHARRDDPPHPVPREARRRRRS